MTNVSSPQLKELPSPRDIARILILTDDMDAARAWIHVLNRHQIEAVVLDYNALARAFVELPGYHEVIIDHYEDAQVALDICRQLRPKSHQPLLLFSYESDERFLLEAYRVGVEECVAKPIGIPLFVAKARAWLRQAAQFQMASTKLRAGNLFLDPETRIFETPQTQVKLSDLECRLMSVFMANRGQVLETNLLVERVWSMYSEPDPRMLKNLVYRLRNKLDRASNGAEYIQSVTGIGYVFHAGR